MIAAIADTHTVIWYLAGSKRLSETAKETIDEIADAGNQVGVSGITLVEAVYLKEKRRIIDDVLRRLFSEVDDPESVFAEVGVDLAVTQAMEKVPWVAVPDMPDRIIAASAAMHEVPVITRDSRLQEADIETIW